MTSLGIVGLLIRNRQIKICSIILLAVIFSYICSIRPLYSADTSTYAYYYHNASSISKLKYGLGRDYFPWVENWFINLCVLSNYIGLSYREFLFWVALAFNILSSYSIYEIYKSKYSPKGNTQYLIIVIIHFFVNYGFLYSYVVIRGGLSFAFCLLAYAMLLNKKKIFAILSMVVAIALHNYSIVVLIIWIIKKIHFKKTHMRFFMIVFAILLVMNVFRIDVWFTNMLQGFATLFTGKLLQVSHYLLDAEQTTSLKKGILLYLIQNIYLCGLYYKYQTTEITNDFVILFVGSLLAVLINDNATIRITNYFFIFQIMLYGKYLARLRENIRNDSVLVITRDSLFHYTLIMLIIPTITFIYMLRYCSII